MIRLVAVVRAASRCVWPARVRVATAFERPRVPSGWLRATGMPRRGLPMLGVLAVSLSIDVASASDWSVSTQSRLDLGVLHHDGPTGWLDGGVGKLGQGRDETAPLARAQFGLDLEYQLQWRARLHGVVDAGNSQAGGRRIGVSEAYVERQWFDELQDRWGLRAGLYFLPGSMENVDRFWSSPYTLTFSAANSWIAEEFRPLGVELGWQRQHDDGRALTLAAGVIWGNDTAGALLAWRGFALHDRLGRYGEIVPLPPLASLAPGGSFGLQDPRGSQTFGRDLDGRAGYTLRTTWQPSDSVALRAAWIDNRGDRDLYGGDYAWRARFGQVGAEWLLDPQWTIAAEWLAGDSGMGFDAGEFAEVDFSTAYLLASWRGEAWRFSLRGEQFRVRDLDRSNAEDNNERGHALTVAAFRDLAPGWELGAEWMTARSRRSAAIEAGLPSERVDGQQLRVELRRHWER